MALSKTLTKDANGAPIQVFSPKVQFDPGTFAVRPGTVFQALADGEYTLTFETGQTATLTVLAGSIRGVPYDVTQVETTFAAAYAGFAVDITPPPAP